MFANFVTSALVRYNYHTHINYNHNSNVNDISSEHLFGFENSPTEKDNQELITRSVQLPHIRVTAFLRSYLFLD